MASPPFPARLHVAAILAGAGVLLLTSPWGTTIFGQVLRSHTAGSHAGDGQSRDRASSALKALNELNASIEALAARVAPSVVQVLATGYGRVDDGSHVEAGIVVGRRQTLGSGAIIDADGYIITNAHVVFGAQHIQVVLHPEQSIGDPLESLAAAQRIVTATLVGVSRDLDIALLKIEVTGLPALRLADYDQLQQGELVFAFGNPEGLQNSMTMGVVSSVARQIDPDSPNVYVQTDAPINPGNSGGPLVNARGELVGLNTFIVSASGGSQGLGFAIPSELLASAYAQLRTYHRLRRGMIGLNVQSITPAMMSGLALSTSAGVIVSDVLPDGPAASAGIQVGDVVTAIDQKAIDSVPLMTLALSTCRPGQTLTLSLIRGDESIPVPLTVAAAPADPDQLVNLNNPDSSAVPALSIFGVDLDERTLALLVDLRIRSGVLVAARVQDADARTPLMAGDIIHAVNSFSVTSVLQLRSLIQDLTPDRDLVVQVERDHRLMFVTVQVH